MGCEDVDRIQLA